MGCFSFLCKECGQPVRSDSYRGERVHLFLLKNGNAIEHMHGEYDSYGRVFDENYNSIEWNMEWDKVCDLMFHSNRMNGIAAIHEKCFESKEVPNHRSEDDPNQGWGPFTVNGETFGDEDEEEDY